MQKLPNIPVMTALITMWASTALGSAPPALDKAVLALVKDPSPYRYALVDLNDDGNSDAVVLMRGSDWCGTGGCTMLIFQGSAEGFKFISRSTVTREPIRILAESAQGWRNLVVAIGGGGGDTGDALMRFDGQEYPLNPSLQPQASPKELVDARTLKLEE